MIFLIFNYCLACETNHKTSCTPKGNLKTWLNMHEITHVNAARHKSPIPGYVICQGQVGNTPVSYLGGPGFKYWPKDRLSWLKFFTILLSSSRQILG
jgi:hypothetical protein